MKRGPTNLPSIIFSMKKSFFTLAAFTFGITSIASATSVTWGAAPTARTVVLQSGSTVSSGLVLVGAFGNTGFSFNSSLDIPSNFSVISTAGNWKQFTLDTIDGSLDANITNTMTITASGKIGGNVTDNNNGPVTPTKADFFNGKQIYLWVFNAATVAASTQMGIFTATTASPVWNFPINQGGLGDGTTLGTTTTSAATMVSAGISGGVGTATSSQLQLVAAVPEPSVFALGGMAALGMLASRKRGMKK